MNKRLSSLKTKTTILIASTMLFFLASCGSEEIAQAQLQTAANNGTLPTINNVVGDVATGNSVTISGAKFTEKENASPLFWWKADMGETPSSLGRIQAWDSTFNGETSSAIVAPGSSQAIRWDHGASSGAALAQVIFGTDRTRIYLHRRLYEDFDVTKDFALRSRVTCPAAGQPGPGDTITGTDSGATGVVNSFLQNGSNCTIYYNNIAGSINDDPPVDFLFGETMTAPGIASMTNSEGSLKYPNGILRSFNQKTIRFWNRTQQNNIYIGAQGANSAKFNIPRETTDATLFNGSFNNSLSQIPFQWNIEEVVYKASSDVDIADARWDFYQNGVLASDAPYVSRTAARPDPYSSVFQSQVSNGAQLGSYAYYDSLYIDDSWHRVIICSGETVDKCNDREIQIPTSWSDTSITVELNLGSLDSNTPLYLYVLNKDGIPNINGWPLTPQ